MAKFAYWTLIVSGIILMIAGVATYGFTSAELAQEKIVTTSDACLPDSEVKGPLTAYCMSEVIQKHTLEITEGMTYAELEMDDPRRDTAMSSSFLRASLFTSVLAFGVSALVIGVGAISLVGGLGLRSVVRRSETQ